MPLGKSARLEARIAPEHQRVIQRAAALRGQSVTDFVIAASLDAAERTIAQNDLIELSAADQLRFAEAILNPKPPSKRLKRAFENHRKLIER